MLSPRFPAFAAVLPALVAPLAAQTQLHETKGSIWYEALGFSLAAAGDVDGDGVTDWIAGAPASSVLTASSGRATVVSGATYATIHSFLGTLPGGDFGFAVAAAGDLDGDGRDDVLVGAPDLVPGPGHLVPGSTPGEVRAFSGASGALLFTLAGAQAGDEFGYSIARLDLDGDLVPDFAVGAPLSDSGGASSGRVQAHSGASLALLWRFVGPKPGDLVGAALAVVGDVDGDGQDDLLVGANGSDVSGKDSGAAYLVSGADGSVLRTLVGQSELDLFGGALAGPGDLDGDGTPDLVVCARWSDAGFPSGGSVYAFSGADGSGLWRRDGRSTSSGLGFSVAVVGDVNADGVADLVAGAGYDDAQGARSGYADVLSGVDGSLLGRVYGKKDEYLGWASAGLGDLDGDGRPEFLVGGLDFGNNSTGIVRLFEADWPMPPSTFCTGKVSSQGCVPAISSSGTPSSSGPDDFVLRADQVVNQKFGMAIWSLAPSASWSMGGTLCLSGSVHRTTVLHSGGNVGPDDCSGTFASPFTQASMAQHGLVPGTLVHAQFWYRDPALPYNTAGFSDALAFLVAP